MYVCMYIDVFVYVSEDTVEDYALVSAHMCVV